MANCKIAAVDLLRLASLATTATAADADEVLEIVRRSSDLADDPAPAATGTGTALPPAKPEEA